MPTAILIADVNIPSNKIGFVKKGAQVEVSIDAFPHQILEHLVARLSLYHPHRYRQTMNIASYDIPQLYLDNQFLETNVERSLKLRPGMTISANITLRKAS